MPLRDANCQREQAWFRFGVWFWFGGRGGGEVGSSVLDMVYLRCLADKLVESSAGWYGLDTMFQKPRGKGNKSTPWCAHPESLFLAFMGLGLCHPDPTDLASQGASTTRAGPHVAHHHLPASSVINSHSLIQTPGSAAFGERVSRSLTAHSRRPPCFLACRPRQGLTRLLIRIV